MKISNRLAKLERSTLQTQINGITKNLASISDPALMTLCDQLLVERERRGLVEKPEIVAARRVFQQLIAQKQPEEQALQMVLAATKDRGFTLLESDILNEHGELL